MQAKKGISKKILGVDPGTNLLGFAIVEVLDKQVVKVLDCGIISLKKELDHQTKLKEIFLQLQELIETYLPDEMALEAPFFGKNVQSMLKLGRAQGVAMAAGMTMGLEIAEYSPKKVKQAVTGNGNASKEQVASMVSVLLNIDTEFLHLDTTDALAVAMCHHFATSSTVQLPKKGGWKKFLTENPDRIV